MAYTRKREPGCPLPVEPQVLAVSLINSAAAADYPIYVPWKNVELTYAYSVVTSAIDNTGSVSVKFELNAASGTSLGTMTVAQNASAGTLADWTAGTASHLSSDNTSIDAVNIEVDGSATGTGEFTIFMYFEKYRQ